MNIIHNRLMDSLLQLGYTLSIVGIVYIGSLCIGKHVYAATPPTVDFQTTTNVHPVLTGTYPSAESNSLNVNIVGLGEFDLNTDLSLFTSGDKWILDLSVAGNALASGTYDIVVTALLTAGGIVIDQTENELVIDVLSLVTEHYVADCYYLLDGTKVNDNYFFSCTTGSYNNDPEMISLWKTDGTKNGTVLIKRFWASPDILASIDMTFFDTSANGILFFLVEYDYVEQQIWRSDGTEIGTFMIKDLRSSSSITSFGARYDAIELDNDLLFFVHDGTQGTQLWKSDGTEIGTMMVAGTLPSDAITSTTRSGGSLFFVIGQELWKSDGATLGTTLVNNFSVVGNYYPPFELVDVNGTLFFWIDNAQTSMLELWKTDDPQTGTVLVKGGFPLPPPRYSPVIDRDFYHMVNINGTLFFAGRSEEGYNGELWKSDGTEGGTILVNDFHDGSKHGPREMTNVSGKLYFSIVDLTSYTWDLWVSEGTSQSTRMVQSFVNPNYSWDGVNYPQPQGFTSIDSTLFFAADDGVHGSEIWWSSGTPVSTMMIEDLNIGDADATLGHFMSDVNGTLIFPADGGVQGDGMWAYAYIPRGNYDVTLSGGLNGTYPGMIGIETQNATWISRDSVADLKALKVHLNKGFSVKAGGILSVSTGITP